MLLLFETANGLALFRMPDGTKPDELSKFEKARSIIKLEDFHKFTDMKEAVETYANIFSGDSEGISDVLTNFLKDNYAKKANKSEKLAIADQRLGNAVFSSLGISCIYNQGIIELMRQIRGFSEKILKVTTKDETDMQIGLAHSLSRYVLRFNCDALDTMVVQAINLLDDIEKEINLYTMRLKEWYGWHFPELVEVISSGRDYANAVLLIGNRLSLRKKQGAKEEMNGEAISRLTEAFGEEVTNKVIEKANISFGTDITKEDFESISQLAEGIINAIEERSKLSEYIKNRMRAIAPSLTALVGDVVGARLLAHAGSIITLARYPASTVQIIGAEKAYFRAVKASNTTTRSYGNGKAQKVRTPKYGIIFHSSLVTQQPAKLRGKAARIVACRASLASRHDAIYVRQLHGNAMDMEQRELEKAKGQTGKEFEDTKREIDAKVEESIAGIADDDSVKAVEKILMSFVNRRLDEIQVSQSSKSIKKDRRKVKQTTDKFTKSADRMGDAEEMGGKKEIKDRSVFVQGGSAVTIGSKRKDGEQANGLEESFESETKAPSGKRMPEGQVEKKEEKKAKLIEVVSETHIEDEVADKKEEMVVPEAPAQAKEEPKERSKSPKTLKSKTKKSKKLLKSSTKGKEIANKEEKEEIVAVETQASPVVEAPAQKEEDRGEHAPRSASPRKLKKVKKVKKTKK